MLSSSCTLISHMDCWPPSCHPKLTVATQAHPSLPALQGVHQMSSWQHRLCPDLPVATLIYQPLLPIVPWSTICTADLTVVTPYIRLSLWSNSCCSDSSKSLGCPSDIPVVIVIYHLLPWQTISNPDLRFVTMMYQVSSWSNRGHHDLTGAIMI